MLKVCNRRLAMALALACGTSIASNAHAQHRVVEALLRETRASGAVDQAAAETVLRGRLRAMERCLTAPFRVGSAELHITLTIGSAGRVTSASMQPAPLPRPAMQGCVLGALRAARFSTTGGGAATVEAVFEINW